MEQAQAREIVPLHIEPSDAAGSTTVRRCLLVLGVLSAGNIIGVASSLYLAVHHPLLLVVISPLGRHLLLVAPTVDPVAFVTVAVLRRTVFATACFFLGRALGPTVMVWLGAHASWARRFYGWFDRFFRRASVLALLLLPIPAMSAVAGNAGMRTARFLPLVMSGLALRMLLVLQLGAWLQEPIERLLTAIERQWIGGTIVIIIGLVLYQWYRLAPRPVPAISSGGDDAPGR
jgi:membrane protein DedA with SNARE-associated domain